MPIIDTVGSYATAIPPGYAGMVAETQVVRDVASRAVETAQVAFGLAVGRGSLAGTCRLGGTGFEGVTVADKSRLNDVFAVGEVAGVLRKGTMWVTAGAAIANGDPAYFTAATGALTNSATGTVAIPNAKFETAGAAGELVRLYIG